MAQTSLPISDELACEAYDLLQQYGCLKRAAPHTSDGPVAPATIRNRAQRAVDRNLREEIVGLKPRTGMQIKDIVKRLDAKGNVSQTTVKQVKEGKKFEYDPDFHVSRISTMVNPDETEGIRWVIQNFDKKTAKASAKEVKEIFNDIVPLPPIKILKRKEKLKLGKDKMILMPFSDAHIGLLAWGKETGKNWDTKIAMDEYFPAVKDCIDRSPYAEKFVFLGGGDFLHADDDKNATPGSGNHLQVETRPAKSLRLAVHFINSVAQYAAQKYPKVEIRILPGNHDPNSCHTLAIGAEMFFRNTKHIEIDSDPGMYWFGRWGQVQLAATHGHACKPDHPLHGLAPNMAGSDKTNFGECDFHYGHTFHIHNKNKWVFETMRIIIESHQAPTAQDAWHRGMGYMAGRCLTCITYHKTKGEMERITHNMLS